jgi:hypothetical protein
MCVSAQIDTPTNISRGKTNLVVGFGSQRRVAVIVKNYQCCNVAGGHQACLLWD